MPNPSPGQPPPATGDVGRPNRGPAALSTAAVAAVLLFNALLWTAYVVHLPALVAKTGLGPEVLPLLLLADQLVFAFMDPLCGFFAHQVSRAWRLAGPLLVGVLLAATVALLALPLVASAGPAIFLPLLLLWAITASVARAPVLALLQQHVAPGTFPGAAGVCFVGIGLAGAVSPLLTPLLKGLHPLLPFAAASAAVVVAAMALAVAERWKVPTLPPAATPGAWVRLCLSVLAFGSLSLAFQVHTATRIGPLWTALVATDVLPLAIPTFWAAFSLAVAPLGFLARGFPVGIFVSGGLLFAIATGVSTAPYLPALAIGQLLAGLGWAGVFTGGLAATLAFAPSRGTGLGIGAFFCLGSLATAARMGLVASGLLGRIGAAGVDVLVVGLALVGALGAAFSGLGRRASDA